MRRRSLWIALVVCCVAAFVPSCTPSPYSQSPTVVVGVGIGHPYGYGPGWRYPPRYYPPRPMGPPHRPPYYRR